MNSQKKVALVTGAARGIGRAIAVDLVSFLAFKGSYITGAVIQVDGGMGM
jgi:NAD(P)-dependent dehydrogenase (short-subunit alcohol dehydrogenase family)